jgi:hypothetical protein
MGRTMGRVSIAQVGEVAGVKSYQDARGRAHAYGGIGGVGIVSFSFVLRRALSRQVWLAGAAFLCAAVLAGCASGAASDHGPAAGAVASGSAPAAGPRVHPAKTPVPPPVRGNIHQKVRAVTVTTRRPVSLRAVAHFGTGVTARILSVRAIEYQAVAPGQVSGPGLRLVIQVHNGTAKPIGLDNAVVAIADARGTPGVAMLITPTGSGDDAGHPGPGNFSYPMRGLLAPGHQASGTYVFTIPAGHRDPVTVNFSYAGGGPVVLFRGDAA